MAQSVLLAQLSQEESLLWHSILSAHQIEVWAAPENEDLLKLLDQKSLLTQDLPKVIISDIGVRYGAGKSLLATELCKWQAENAPDLKILLINPRQTQIKDVERRWAIRRGAVDLLPKTSLDNLTTSFATVAQILGIKIDPEHLSSIILNIKQQKALPDRSSIQSKNIRQAASQDLARKMAMIPLMVMAGESSIEKEFSQIHGETGSQKAQQKKFLALDSTLAELKLYEVKIDLNQKGEIARELFKADSLLPALLVYDQDRYVGMISRRKFLECLSRPYALELFTKRPLRVLYEQVEANLLNLQGTTSIVAASQVALNRGADDIYEPIVVTLGEDHCAVLDVHDLLQAQSYIHELATKLLREQTQTSMIQTEKMASLGQIVAEVSHDIRNPVSAIYGNTECLLEYIEGVMKILRAYEKEYGTNSPLVVQTLEEIDWEFVRSDLPQVVKSIQSGSKYLRRLVDTLQSLSHMEDHATPVAVDLGECIDSSLTILSGRVRSVQISKHYAQLPRITGYSDRLIQVFMNLVSNALDALMEMQAHPELIQEREKMLTNAAKGVEPNLARQNALMSWQPNLRISTTVIPIDGISWISVKIADNGKGIPKEIQDRIFDNFFTTKGEGKGTGLGLAICHQIITQQHGGRIVLRSPYTDSQGATVTGTEFEVLLPVK
ncbi:MAG: hybrid sensor histidine kinase/response regulator [Pseudanabaenaceae cyanobacterium bins.39]|nr:hybrid sensor histidine kinase/response regulator [Pseudanabaenaceae cyanobacterium bins.39]